MASITVQKHIAAPLETVFEYATDLRRAPARVSAIRKLEVLTDGPVAAGTRFRETRVLFKREATEEMEITRFERPSGYTVSAESHGTRYRTDFAFRAAADAGTDVDVTFDAEPLTVSAKIMGFLMKPMLKSCAKLFAHDLDDLARAIEADRAASAQPAPRG